MAPRKILRRIIIALVLLPFVSVALIPHNSVHADPIAKTPALPDLASFTLTVINGDSATLRGVYADGAFALPVVQQPTSDAGYVSRKDNVITQFGMASAYGNIGLLAHNTLSGRYFFQLYQGERIQLVYGDGRIEYFVATNIYRYQAVSPYSANSDFIDLDTRAYLTALDLFHKVYMGSRRITFQTCIEANGNSSWGRLFVIAEPEVPNRSDFR